MTNSSNGMLNNEGVLNHGMLTATKIAFGMSDSDVNTTHVTETKDSECRDPEDNSDDDSHMSVYSEHSHAMQLAQFIINDARSNTNNRESDAWYEGLTEEEQFTLDEGVDTTIRCAMSTAVKRAYEKTLSEGKASLELGEHECPAAVELTDDNRDKETEEVFADSESIDVIRNKRQMSTEF